MKRFYLILAGEKQSLQHTYTRIRTRLPGNYSKTTEINNYIMKKRVEDKNFKKRQINKASNLIRKKG